MDKKGLSYNTKLGIYLTAMVAIVALVTSGYMDASNREINQESVPFASLYQAPNWPSNQEDSKLARYVIDYSISGDPTKIDSLKSLLPSNEASYWLSEMYLQQSQADSVLKYLPDGPFNNARRDRANYLLIMGFYLKDESEKVVELLKVLPENTADTYVRIYEKML